MKTKMRILRRGKVLLLERNINTILADGVSLRSFKPAKTETVYCFNGSVDDWRFNYEAAEVYSSFLYVKKR